jgi:hypothetical protein
MNKPKLIRRPPPALLEWATLVGLSYVLWPLDEWRWRPTVGQQVVVGVNQWFAGADTMHLLWIHPEVFFNGWSSGGPEHLHLVRIVTVRFVASSKTKDQETEVLVEILSVVDPWQVEDIAPVTVTSLDRIKPTRGVTEIVSSEDRTVVYRNDESDQTFQYYLFTDQMRIVLLIDEGLTGSYFYWGNGALSETQMEEAIGSIEHMNDRTQIPADLFAELVAAQKARGDGSAS